MARYRSTCNLTRLHGRSAALLVAAHIAADYLAPILCRVGLHLWDHGQCVECPATQRKR